MKAMILAAGLGTRLGKLTAQTPKCLMQVGGKTMLEHAVHSLKQAGVTSIVINTHHHAEKVKEFVRASENFGLEVQLSFEPTLLGTGGGLRNVEKHFSSEELFIVTNADIYCEANFGDFIQAQKTGGGLGTLVVMERTESSYLLFDGTPARLVGWERAQTPSKEPISKTVERKAFCGIQVLSPRIFSFMMGTETIFSIIDTYMQAVTQEENLFPFEITNQYWIDIGTPEQLQRLRTHLG